MTKKHTRKVLAGILAGLWLTVQTSYQNMRSMSGLALSYFNTTTASEPTTINATRENGNTNNNKSTTITVVDFEHQPGVAIVTTIHGPLDWPQLVQSQCLLQAAYNSRTHYNLVVFTTEPIAANQIANLQAMLHPATVTVKVDDQNLKQMLHELTDAQKQHMLDTCLGVNSISDISWTTKCHHPGFGDISLAYNWQAEFRSKQLWLQPELSQYKYMVWYDSDAFATVRWTSDPVAEFIRNDLILLMDHFPAGSINGPEMQGKFQRAFGRIDTLCGIGLTADGHLDAKYSSNCGNVPWRKVHGFFHITNLDFYRSEIPQRWIHEMIGDTKFSRKYDDQAAVTLPAAVLEPHRSWDMRKHGINLQILHNGVLDGQEYWRQVDGQKKLGFFGKFWQEIGQHRFPEAIELKCPVSNPGR